MVNFIEVIIPSEHNDRRIDRFLRFFFKDLSQSDIEKLLRSKMIRLNGKKVTSDIRISEQNLLRYPDFLVANDSFSSENQSKHIQFPSDIILYEDTDLMVINKPHGLASQGGSNIKIHLDMMLESLPKKNNYRPSTIHRLDKDTSGCLVVAKKPSIAARLGEALKNREFQKYYLAITDNIPSNSCGSIENYLLKSLINKQDIIQIVDANTHKAQFSKSVYYVISKNDTHRKSLILLSPITGRTHQLRIHCQSIKCSIIGDKKYNVNNTAKKQEKLCLHAAKIIFTHPITKEKLEIDAPLPDHFKKIADYYQLSLKKPISYDNKEILNQLL